MQGVEIPKKDITKEQWPQFIDAIRKEWQTWLRYGVVIAIPAARAKKIRRSKRVSARCVFSDKNHRARRDDK